MTNLFTLLRGKQMLCLLSFRISVGPDALLLSNETMIEIISLVSADTSKICNFKKLNFAVFFVQLMKRHPCRCYIPNFNLHTTTDLSINA